MITCKICNKECNVLSRHLFNSHKEITAKQYYDLHFKKENEGICLVCKKETNFINMTTGYHTYCSTRCTQLDPQTTKKKSDTYFKKTGFTHNMRNPASIQPFNIPEVRQKTIDAVKALPDEVWKKRDEKIVETCLEKYGVSNVFKTEEMKMKSKETKLVKYGDEHYHNHKKAQETFAKNHNGCVCPTQTQEYKDKVFPLRRITVIEKIKKEISEKKIEITLLECIDLNKIKFFCHVCNKEFVMQYQMFWIRISNNENICNNCTPYCSRITRPHRALIEFIESISHHKCESNNKSALDGLELDIWIPEIRFAVEYNGSYWHSTEKQPDQFYHSKKCDIAFEKGITLLQIFEDEWMEDTEDVKNLIRYFILKEETIKIEDVILSCENEYYLDKGVGLYHFDKILKERGMKVIKDVEPTLYDRSGYETWNCGFRVFQ